MKKLALITAIIFVFNSVKGQYVDVPDARFRAILKNKYPSCFNNFEQLDTTCNEIVGEDTLNISGNATITDLTGLNYFKNLIYLNCSELYQVNTMPEWPSTLKHLEYSTFAYPILSLPALPNSLEYLNCSGHGLRSSLPLLPNSLKYLNCSFQQHLTALPTLPSSLDTLICGQSGLIAFSNLPQTIKYIDAGYNKIKSIDYLPNSLEYFDCSHSELSSLPKLPLGLKKLYCYGNKIGPILPDLPAGLKVLDCRYNSLISLPDMVSSLDSLTFMNNKITQLPVLPQSMRYLNCSINPLHEISHIPDSLLFLNCSSNSLTNLPPLPHSLKILYCNGNLISTLPLLPEYLEELNCSVNRLTSLPYLPNSLNRLHCSFNEIYCLPRLPLKQPNEFFDLTIDFDKINCLPNYQPNYFVRMESSCCIGFPGLPLCNPANNSNRCQSFSIISGNVFYDTNSNGIKDTNEYYKSNLKFELSNGDIAYTNSNGYFEIGTDSLGTYTITPTAPNYFNVVPSSSTYNFTSYDTIVAKDYALQANTIKDSLSIKLTPVNRAARPGFSFPYSISYENAGTTTLSPNIVFNYDNTKLNYDSSSNAVINNGNSLSLSAGSFVPGQQGNFVVYFTLRPTVVIGDSVSAKATVTGNTATATDSSKVVVRGSYDPNDKQATPRLSPSQVFAGKYINYTIRFQNTGTDTAFNVVIADTLSNELQWNTLEMLNTSHPCKTTVNGDKVYFEFLNILLPDSNVNEQASHGFINFRIKPKPTVPANTTINNKASIYFDYNAPVITNTAGTLIQDNTVLPLRLISFSAIPQTNTTTTLYWNTANEINTSRFVIEQSIDGIRFNSVNSVFAKGMQSNSYSITVTDAAAPVIYYRIKMIDKDGNFVYTPVLKISRKNANGFSVLTNPVKDFIVINTTDRSLNNTTGSIINMQGVVVKNFIIKEGSQTIEVKNLPAGMCYLRTVNGSSKILVR